MEKKQREVVEKNFQDVDRKKKLDQVSRKDNN